MGRRKQQPPQTSAPRTAPAESADIAPPPPVDTTAIIAIKRREDLSGVPREVTPEGLELVRRLAREGQSNDGIAAILGINRDTFLEIRKRQREVDEALISGRAVLEHELTHILLSKARKGDTVAAIYLTKARFGWKEGTERDGAGATVNVQVIQLPAAATSKEQWLAFLEADGVEKDPEGDGS